MISLETKIRILVVTVMAAVELYFEAKKLRKIDEDLLDVFQRNCLRIVFGNWLTGGVTNSKMD